MHPQSNLVNSWQVQRCGSDQPFLRTLHEPCALTSPCRVPLQENCKACDFEPVFCLICACLATERSRLFLIGLFYFIFLFNWKRRCVSWLVCLTLLLNEAKRHCYNNGNLARASCCRQHPAVGAGRDFPLPSHQWETGFPMFSILAREKCVVLKKEATCPCLLNDPGSTPSCFQTRTFSSFKAMCEKPVIHL